MQELMSGNVAIARGAVEARVHYATGYPGTPSTEILETISSRGEVDAEWSANEKVALDAAMGVSLGCAESLSPQPAIRMNIRARVGRVMCTILSSDLRPSIAVGPPSGYGFVAPRAGRCFPAASTALASAPTAWAPPFIFSRPFAGLRHFRTLVQVGG